MLTREQFEEHVKGFWSQPIYEQCKSKITECHCGSTLCLGWTMPVSPEDWAAASFGPENRLEV